MSVWHYHYHGVSVTCDLELPEWAFCETVGKETPPEVRIRLANRDNEQLAGDFLLPIRDIATFTIRGTHEIIVAPDSRASGPKVRLFLIGSAWGALMYRRGALLIHASAVGTSRGAVAFCAKTGSGKSTLAALLSSGRLGAYPLLSDDLCCIRLSSEAAPLLFPSVPRLRLWHDAAEELGWKNSAREEDHFRPGKHLYPKRDARNLDPVPLRALYILGWGTLGVTRLRGFHAITRLLAASTWRGDLLMAVGKPEEHFAGCSALLRQVECWEFRRPRELGQLIENTRVLIRHFSEPEP